MARCKICGRWFKPYAANYSGYVFGEEELSVDEVCKDCAESIEDALYGPPEEDEEEEDDLEDDDYEECRNKL